MNSRTGTGDILHTQIQQGGGGHGLATHNHAQTTSGIWDLANSTDMSYELAAAGTGNASRAKLSTKSLSMVQINYYKTCLYNVDMIKKNFNIFSVGNAEWSFFFAN